MRLKLWKTNPILRLRICASWNSSSSPVAIPSMRYFPPVGESRHPMMFIMVDLPDPDAPTIATNSPRPMLRLTPSSARTSASPWP
jgi:hypothetical protein